MEDSAEELRNDPPSEREASTRETPNLEESLLTKKVIEPPPRPHAVERKRRRLSTKQPPELIVGSDIKAKSKEKDSGKSEDETQVDVELSPFYSPRCLDSKHSPDPRAQLHHALGEIAMHIRDLPTIPADPSDAGRP